MNEFTVHESSVSYFDSFIAIETYICMTSMMMLDIICVSKSLPLKDRPQAWLRHSLALLETLWYFRHFGIGFGEILLFWTLG